MVGPPAGTSSGGAPPMTGMPPPNPPMLGMPPMPPPPANFCRADAEDGHGDALKGLLLLLKLLLLLGRLVDVKPRHGVVDGIQKGRLVLLGSSGIYP